MTCLESSLSQAWQPLQKKGTLRACLFTLILYAQEGARCEYYKHVVEKMIAKYPCRVIFITKGAKPFETKVSIIQESSGFACDMIEITYSQIDDEEKIPFLVLPLLIPDLPVTLLWSEDPQDLKGFACKLEKMATRLIFDSENAQDMELFAKKLLEHKKEANLEIADLNWARFSGFRSLFRSFFSSSDRIKHLLAAKKIEISYCSKKGPFFCHERAQAHYFQSWILSHLPLSSDQVVLKPQEIEGFAAGMILSVDIITNLEGHFYFKRNPDLTQQITMQFSTKELCEIPLQFLISTSLAQNSLIKEITNKTTSLCFFEALTRLAHG